MKALWEAIQTVFFVLFVGAIIVAIPILGLFLAISGTIVFIYMTIKDNKKRS